MEFVVSSRDTQNCKEEISEKCCKPAKGVASQPTPRVGVNEKGTSGSPSATANNFYLYIYIYIYIYMVYI